MNDAEWLDIFNAYAMEKRDAVWRYDDDNVNWDYWSDNSNTVAIDEGAVTFDSGHGEMLKITKDGFYVRGVKVEQDPGEAEAVYAAFKEFMTWAILSKPQAEE